MIVWDIVLGLSTTDPIGDDVAEWAVVTAYVGGRFAREDRAQTCSNYTARC